MMSDSARSMLPMVINFRYVPESGLWRLEVDSLTLADMLIGLGIAVKLDYAPVAPVVEAIRAGVKTREVDD